MAKDFAPLYNSLNSRLLTVEQALSKLNIQAGGNIQFLKGEPGDIQASTDAALKVMQQKFEEQKQQIAAIGNELRAIHDQFKAESAQVQVSFMATPPCQHL